MLVDFLVRRILNKHYAKRHFRRGSRERLTSHCAIMSATKRRAMIRFPAIEGNRLIARHIIIYSNCYQMCALLFFGTNILSPFFTLKALYHASICGSAALTRAMFGE